MIEVSATGLALVVKASKTFRQVFLSPPLRMMRIRWISRRPRLLKQASISTVTC